MNSHHRTYYPNRKTTIATILVCLSLVLPGTLLAGNPLDVNSGPW